MTAARIACTLALIGLLQATICVGAAWLASIVGGPSFWAGLSLAAQASAAIDLITVGWVGVVGGWAALKAEIAKAIRGHT